MTICIVINFKLSRHYLLMELADQTEIQLSGLLHAKLPKHNYCEFEIVGSLP